MSIEKVGSKRFTIVASYSLNPDGTRKPLGAALVILKEGEHIKTIKGRGSDRYEVVVKGKKAAISR